MMRHGPHVRRHEPIRLGRWHERSVYLSTGLLMVTGALWLVFHYFMRTPGEFGEQPHVLEYWWLRLHGATAMLSLMSVGSMLPVHVRRAWELRKNIATGLVMFAVLLVLIATGYALYYFAGGNSRSWISLVHWGLGLALPLALGWHVRSGQLRSIRQPSDESVTPIARAARQAALAAEPRKPAIQLRSR